MSGPIVRRYGFPNFEKIFGERGLQHGVDDAGEPTSGAEPPAPSDPAPNSPSQESEPARPASPPKSEKR